MPSLVHYAVRGSVAVITLDNPPVNALAQTQGLLQQIHDHIEAASRDANVESIVLRGDHRTFSGGADIKEFGKPRAAQYMDLRDLVSYMDTVAKPMVAALHGPTMGGGTELALACHYRVASPDAQVGLPEVKLGLLPGAGGTQRLPRLAGAEAALEMIVTGDPVGAAKAAKLGIVDEVANGDLLEAAVAFAERAARDGLPLRRASAGNATLQGDPQAFFAAARERTARASRGYPAPLQCLECVADAVFLPYEQGYAKERERFMELLRSPESASLRHAFFAEREAAKIPDIGPDVALIPIARAAVIGAGTMGGGIAMNFANAGIPVTVLEAKAENLERGIATIRKNYASTVAKGRLSQEDMDRRMKLIVPAGSYDDIRDADIVVEAVFEEMSVKQSVFREIDRVAKKGAMLATNTSTLDVNKIADSTSRPESVIGTHFFSPANVMRLLEIVRGAKTSKPVVATTMALARRLRKVGVLSGVCDGFIGNRMVEEYLRQAGYLVDEGALPQQVDGVLQKWGLAMGPFAMSDLAGLDIGWAIRKRRALERPAERYSGVADRICELGRFGQKTGAGYYRYEAGSRTPIPDPMVEKIILDYSAERGIQRRTISDEEIVERCIYALVNTGARILDEGIALRASDIDVVYLTGYGFPPYRGGPMFYAQTVGLKRVLDTIRTFHARHGDAWKPAPLLERLVAAGHDQFQPV